MPRANGTVLPFTETEPPADTGAKFILKCLSVFISRTCVNPHISAEIHVTDPTTQNITFYDLLYSQLQNKLNTCFCQIFTAPNAKSMLTEVHTSLTGNSS